MQIIIASESPVKRKATEQAFKALFPTESHDFICTKTDSGISDQPMSCEETLTGSINRVKHARKLYPEANFYVGLEGGVTDVRGHLHSMGWVTIEDPSGKQSHGRTISFALPKAISKLILEEKMELGHATDSVFGQSESKLSYSGTIGPLTNNEITYLNWYTHAVIGDLIPHKNQEL